MEIKYTDMPINVTGNILKTYPAIRTALTTTHAQGDGSNQLNIIPEGYIYTEARTEPSTGRNKPVLLQACTEIYRAPFQLLEPTNLCAKQGCRWRAHL